MRIGAGVAVLDAQGTSPERRSRFPARGASRQPRGARRHGRRLRRQQPDDGLGPVDRIPGGMYLILGLVYLFLFGLMGSLNQLVGNPGLFANLVSAFALFSMSQGFLIF